MLEGMHRERCKHEVEHLSRHLGRAWSLCLLNHVFQRQWTHCLGYPTIQHAPTPRACMPVFSPRDWPCALAIHTRTCNEQTVQWQGTVKNTACLVSSALTVSIVLPAT